MNKLKKSVRMAVNNLIKSGKLKRNSHCLRCLEKCFTFAHHCDYAKPYLIEWLCQSCHDKEHYDTRYKITQEKRKLFDPCKCGKKAVARQMCKTCYARWRASQITLKCVISGCQKTRHTRGLCTAHKQDEYIYKHYALPKERPGTKPKYASV